MDEGGYRIKHVVGEGTTLNTPMLAQQLLLQSWFSPLFPIGSFAYSHGLETAINAGLVASVTDAQNWLSDLSRYGSLWNDLLLLQAAWQATATQDIAELNTINQLALALAPCKERLSETCNQGEAFWAAAQAWLPADHKIVLEDDSWTQPVAAGVTAQLCGVELTAVLAAYAHGFLGNLISILQRALPMGQVDAMQTLAALLRELEEVIAALSTSSLDDLGGCALMSDLCAMAHSDETTRIYRT